MLWRVCAGCVLAQIFCMEKAVRGSARQWERGGVAVFFIQSKLLFFYNILLSVFLSMDAVFGVHPEYLLQELAPVTQRKWRRIEGEIIKINSLFA